MFLSDDIDELLIEEDCLADKQQLKNLLIQQVKLLDCGLYIHGCHLNEGSKLLHDSLVDSFAEYHQKIQQLCGIECNVSLARKTSMDTEESAGQRKHARYLSRLSTDSISLANDLKPAIQQRAMSIACPPTSEVPVKQRLVNTDAPPLPSRRSNRHSLKPLIPKT